MKEHLAGRRERSDATRRIYYQEQLILDVTSAIHAAMEQTGTTKADIARALETSRAHITQTLSGERNMTLRTLADLAWVLDRNIVVRFDEEKEAYRSEHVGLRLRPRGEVGLSSEGVVVDLFEDPERTLAA